MSFIDNLDNEKFNLENVEEIIDSIEKEPFLPTQIDFENKGDMLKERKSYNASLKIPRASKYVKISDLYTLENIKRGLKIHIRK